MKMIRFQGELALTSRFNIKYNSYIPITAKWYRIVNDHVVGINDGDWFVLNYAEDDILSVVDPELYEAIRQDLKSLND